MRIKKFDMAEDFERVEAYLRDRYFESKDMTSWLPERFEDLIYRVDVLHVVERGMPASKDYIYIWEESGSIVGVLLPDSDSVYTSLAKGHEDLFPEMIGFAEEKLTPLFRKKENGKVDFLVVANDSSEYKVKELLRRGYVRQGECDYDNCQNPMLSTAKIILPEGFRQVYGEEIPNDRSKAASCHFGFDPEDDKRGYFREGMAAYTSRKNAPMFKDSFESLVVAGDGEICSYSFCYVDRITNTAFIEPVCTREKYRRMGIGKAMLQGIINRLKDMKVDICFVNSYSEWRKKFYNSAGFITKDTVGFWTKEI